MNLEIPLDQGFSGVFTDVRSGERTPTGAVRRGASAQPTPLTRRKRNRNTDSVHSHLARAAGLPREVGSNDESATVAGDRGGRRVRPGLRPPSGDGGDGDLLGRSTGTGQPAASGRVGETTGHACHLRVAGDLTPSGDRWHDAFGRSAGNGVVVEEPKELGPPQLDSARSVPIGARTEGSGNRVSVKRCQGFETGKPVSSPTRGIARHAARRDGRCEQVETKANARHSTSGGPVHSSSPGRRAGESRQRRPGRFRFPPPPRNVPGS